MPSQQQFRVQLLIQERTYTFTYIDASNNPVQVKGKLNDPDQNGFVVVEVQGPKLILLPKSRIVIAEEEIEEE
ncbi:MAG: hypothetical protein M3441_21355 [Chloroflexota bacterium]|nr:hypothetical protein [Chloroflexota bacterium]